MPKLTFCVVLLTFLDDPTEPLPDDPYVTLLTTTGFFSYNSDTQVSTFANTDFIYIITIFFF